MLKVPDVRMGFASVHETLNRLISQNRQEKGQPRCRFTKIYSQHSNCRTIIASEIRIRRPPDQWHHMSMELQGRYAYFAHHRDESHNVRADYSVAYAPSRYPDSDAKLKPLNCNGASTHSFDRNDARKSPVVILAIRSQNDGKSTEDLISRRIPKPTISHCSA
jgi:hypothetical protein